MHELAITRNIVAVVAEAARGARVCRVTVRIGRLSGIAPSAVRFCFDIVAEGTVVEGALLAIDEVAGRARCRDCGSEIDLPDLAVSCSCGSRNLTLLRGEELQIATIEIEEAA